MKRLRVIGIGQTLAGDDGVGMMVARHLRFVCGSEVDIVEAGVPGVGLLDLLRDVEAAVVIDAVQSGRPPGMLHRLEIPRDLNVLLHAWGRGCSSTHAFGLGETLMLGQTLGLLPAIMRVYGIEIGQIERGNPLSPPLLAGFHSAARQIQQDIEQLVAMLQDLGKSRQEQTGA
ncbi:MAG: hydrogenase maturation protease [Nitrospirae bacterium]|nr:MAG: hydrogenase maturation protease [Nitrospirota bacterium]